MFGEEEQSRKSLDIPSTTSSSLDNVDTELSQLTEAPGNLEDQLTNEKLIKLEEIFEEADEDGGGGLDMEEFRKAMRQTMGDNVTDKDLDMIFMKVDTNCDGTVDWDEYLTYMLLECSGKDTMNVQASRPFPTSLQLVQDSPHKDSIIRMLYLPKVMVHEPGHCYIDTSKGRYLTISKEGTVCFWGIDMHLLGVHNIVEPPDKDKHEGQGKDLWVTDCAALLQQNMLFVGTTSRSIRVYDITGSRFEFMSCVSAIDDSVTCMTVSHNITWQRNQQDWNGHPIMFWGDARGNVSALKFLGNPHKTVLNPRRGGKRNRIPFPEILKGDITNIQGFHQAGVHADLVRQIQYYPRMGSFVSCSKDSDTSLYLGDMEQNHVVSSYFKVKKGINTFDICRSLNVIATGGYDGVVRLWNPYVTAKPVVLLQGHQSSLLHVLFSPIKEQIISVAENKEVRIHDLNTQTCIQTLFRKMMVDLGPRLVTMALYNAERNAFFVGTNSLCMMEHYELETEAQLITSHTCVVNIALYNPLFHQVVSADVDSMICVWDMTSGHKVMQFSAYTYIVNGETVTKEITNINFDPTYRRLITASRDGCIKIWNFNNGACLRILPNTDHCEITGIVWCREQIITSGWGKKVNIYLDDNEDDSVRDLTPEHREDIMSMGYYPPSSIITGSYDGDILIWSMETGRLQFILNNRISQKPISVSSRLQAQQCDDSDEDDDDDVKSQCSDSSEDNDRGYPTLTLTTVEEHLDKASSTQPGNGHKDGMDHENHPYSVTKLIVLQSRRLAPDTAQLMVAYNNGDIKSWSIDHKGGMLGEFNAVHLPEISLSSMATDPENSYLVTADSRGYIRVWDIMHYHNQDPPMAKEERRIEVHEQFHFLRWTGHLTHATSQPIQSWLRAFLKEKSRPPLLSSFRAHLAYITNVDYAKTDEGRQFIVSSSQDCSLRLWTLQGQYIGIFGQPMQWNPLHLSSPSVQWRSSRQCVKGRVRPVRHYKLAPDIRRVASFTTMFVTKGGQHPGWYIAKHLVTWINKWKKLSARSASAAATIEDDMLFRKGISTKSIAAIPDIAEVTQPCNSTPSVLGKFYQARTRHKPLPKLPKLRHVNTSVSVYGCLPFMELAPIMNVQPPDTIREIRQRNKSMLQSNDFASKAKMVRGLRRLNNVNQAIRGRRVSMVRVSSHNQRPRKMSTMSLGNTVSSTMSGVNTPSGAKVSPSSAALEHKSSVAGGAKTRMGSFHNMHENSKRAINKAANHAKVNRSLYKPLKEMGSVMQTEQPSTMDMISPDMSGVRLNTRSSEVSSDGDCKDVNSDSSMGPKRKSRKSRKGLVSIMEDA